MSHRTGATQYGEVCTWTGVSSRRYRFSVYPVDAPTLPLDGVFILAAPGDLFVPFRPIYIGEAENFEAFLPLAPERFEAIDMGATTLHLYYSNRTHPDRKAVWRDLVRRYRPALNAADMAPEALEPALEAGHTAQIIPFPRQRRAVA